LTRNLKLHLSDVHLLLNEKKQIDQTTYSTFRWHDETHFYKKITVTDPKLPSQVDYTEKVAKFSLGDFTDMFSYQGLQVKEVFGDYQFNGYDVRKTPRLIIIATKTSMQKEDKEKRLYSDGRTTDALT